MEARGPSRTAAFSQWETTYDHDNKVTDELKKTYDFSPFCESYILSTCIIF